MKFQVSVLLLCLLANLSVISINCLNVETQHFTVYRQEKRSMFGFSVAEHLDERRSGWVIVGAPEAQTEQYNVNRGGSVYRCDPSQDDACTPIYFDTEGDAVKEYEPGIPVQISNKSMQWFGASVSTTQTADGPILACAPRYVWFSTGAVRREPVGTCFITKNSFREPKEFSPCRTRNWGYHRQGSCQAGLGAALTKNGERVFIGAPGSYYWQGQVYSINSKSQFPYIPPRFYHFGERSGQAISGSTESLPAAVFTKEGRAIDDDSYLGYSVATVKFGINGETGAAVGMPRGENLQGKVVLLWANMTSYNKNLTGVQMGSYFGYSVISCDVDGDGYEDLVIGAPMYTIEDNPEMTFETGRVHVFYQGSGAEKFSRSETRDGVEDRGRFGLSLASLKDINLDGYEDFVVGAPYGGPDGQGAVYIYHGSRNGVAKSHSQAIYAKQLGSQLSTFGFSVAGGLDLDGNQYPDMVVGAYESSSAAFFRSRPIFNMNGFVAFDSKKKFISLETKDCKLSDNRTAACLPLDTFLNFTGVGVDRSYAFNVQYLLDVKRLAEPRLFFRDYENRTSFNLTVRLEHGEPFARTFIVYVNPEIRDKLTPLEAEMRISLVENSAAGPEPRNPRSELTPVLGVSALQPDSIFVQKECGEDNVCIPKLEMLVKPSVKKYLLDSKEKLYLDVLVENTGEDAFEAMYHLKLPRGMDYAQFEQIDKTKIPVYCSVPEKSDNSTEIVNCDLGNPLPGNNSVHFRVFIQPSTFEGMNANYEMEMTVNTTNPEANENQADNYYRLSLPVWVQTELVIDGKSRPAEIPYNPEKYTDENITSELQFGPAFTHNYIIRNDGPSEILEATAFLIWPAQTLAGEELVYLMEQPKTSGGTITCLTANANYLSLVREEENRGTSYSGSYDEYSGLSSAEIENKLAENERRKQQEQQPNEPLPGTKEDDLNSEFFFSNSSSSSSSSSSSFKNFSSSGEESRNFSSSGGSSVSGEQRANFVSQEGNSAQGAAVLIPAPEIVTEVFGGSLQATNTPPIQIPSRHGQGEYVDANGEIRHEQTWNRTGSFQHGWGSSTGGATVAQEENRRNYESGNRDRFGEVGNREGSLSGGVTVTEEERRRIYGSGNTGDSGEVNWNSNRESSSSGGRTLTEEERRRIYGGVNTGGSGEVNWDVNRGGSSSGGVVITEEERRRIEEARNRGNLGEVTWSVNREGSSSGGRTLTEEEYRRIFGSGIEGLSSSGRRVLTDDEYRRIFGSGNTGGSGEVTWKVNREGSSSGGVVITEEERRRNEDARNRGNLGEVTWSVNREGSSSGGRTLTEEEYRRIFGSGIEGLSSSGRRVLTDDEYRRIFGSGNTGGSGEVTWKVNREGSSSGGVVITEEERRRNEDARNRGNLGEVTWSVNREGSSSGGRTLTEEEYRRIFGSGIEGLSSSGRRVLTDDEYRRIFGSGNTGGSGEVTWTVNREGSSSRGGELTEEEYRRIYGSRNQGSSSGERTNTDEEYRRIYGSGNRGGSSGEETKQTAYGVEQHFETRGSSSGQNLHLSNIGSAKDLEKFFSTINQNAASITTHTRNGRDYVLFDGRFRVAGGKEVIEFRNGQFFDLLTRDGGPSYSTGRGHTGQFLSMEGQLVGGDDGSMFIELEDGRRFKIPGTYSYQKTETFTVGGGPRESQVYGRHVTQGEFGPVKTNWREESSYNKNWKSEGSGSRKTFADRFDNSGDNFNGDNVPTQRPDERLSRYPRESDMIEVDDFVKREKRRRRTRDVGGIENSAESQRPRSIEGADYTLFEPNGGESCKGAKCVSLQCTIGRLAKGDVVWVSMRARVKAKTLNEIGFNDEVKVSTQLIARVTRQPFISGTPTEQITKSHEIQTIVKPTPLAAPDFIPLWVVVLSACAGTIILLLLIFLLYKCGFFKRNRPTDAAERQPLNRSDQY